VTRKTRALLGRRDFLRAVVVATGPALVVACANDDARTKRAKSPGFFPQSVASGDPRPGSVVLWTRVEDAETTGPL